ncbi:MAG: tRNA pseudouridine(38-40) synthase TruA [Clostridiales bacterium]|nr:tRNA pseudouridine(38-40) synthase TruA [Clostridiales bacterium]
MRYKLEISYDGTNYSGFQIQPNKDTIQKRLEDAMMHVYRDEIDIVASGRTDAGVSAICQVCHFDTECNVDTRRDVGYLNSILPENIRVLSISEASVDFHARKSAKNKTYIYNFYTGREIPVYDKFATNIGYNLDIEKMKEACRYIQGEHDFTAFCASNTAVVDKVRIVYDIKIIDLGENLYRMEITGNGFLYNMVRIIMGTLVSVGMGKIRPEDIVQIIESKNRANSGKTMPAKGLVLKKVIYSNV